MHTFVIETFTSSAPGMDQAVREVNRQVKEWLTVFSHDPTELAVSTAATGFLDQQGQDWHSFSLTITAKFEFDNA